MKSELSGNMYLRAPFNIPSQVPVNIASDHLVISVYLNLRWRALIDVKESIIHLHTNDVIVYLTIIIFRIWYMACDNDRRISWKSQSWSRLCWLNKLDFNNKLVQRNRFPILKIEARIQYNLSMEVTPTHLLKVSWYPSWTNLLIVSGVKSAIFPDIVFLYLTVTILAVNPQHGKL